MKPAARAGAQNVARACRFTAHAVFQYPGPSPVLPKPRAGTTGRAPIVKRIATPASFNCQTSASTSWIEGQGKPVENRRSSPRFPSFGP